MDSDDIINWENEDVLFKIKCSFPGLRQFLAIESALQMM